MEIHQLTRSHNRSRGFNLIELLITVAIIGILVAIAIPKYSDYVTRSRRADGQAKLMQVAQATRTLLHPVFQVQPQQLQRSL